MAQPPVAQDNLPVQVAGQGEEAVRRRAGFPPPADQGAGLRRTVSPFPCFVLVQRPSNFFKLVFGRAADRAGPVIGQILEGCARRNPVGRVPRFRIIFITADQASVFFHGDSSSKWWKIMWCDNPFYPFQRPWRLQYSLAVTVEASIQKTASGASPGDRFCL